MTTRYSIHDTLEQAQDYADAFVAEASAASYQGRPVSSYAVFEVNGIYRTYYEVAFIDAVVEVAA